MAVTEATAAFEPVTESMEAAETIESDAEPVQALETVAAPVSEKTPSKRGRKPGSHFNKVNPADAAM